MATTSGRPNAGVRSGGKIVKSRRIPAAFKTPYARPAKLPERVPTEEPENPNWLFNLIYPAKMIASGAGKILSLLDRDSSSSSSGADSDENDDDEEEEVENDASFQGDNRSNKVLSPSSKGDNKRAIEQLVTQETFSREEGNELIKLIKSRVVDTDGTLDESTTNMRTTAIMEAKKWLQQKRSGSKKKMEHELDTTTLATPSKITGIGSGSPVDMAKSYMHNRPAWASPSLKQTEFGSPPPLRNLHFKEETPNSTLRSSEMKRSSLSSGSWNILEEIRRVRFKATEEFIAATPLANTGLSSFSPEIDRPQDSLMNNRDVGGAESTHDRAQIVLPDVSARPSRVNQKDNDVVQPVEDQECQEAVDLKSNEDNVVHELRSIAAENGFPSTASGLTAGHDATQNPTPSEEVNRNLVGSIQIETDVHMENPNPDPEPSADVTNVNPTDSVVVNWSQNSSSMQHDEDLSQELSLTNAEHTSRAKANNNAPKERKSRGYTRRARGRGK